EEGVAEFIQVIKYAQVSKLGDFLSLLVLDPNFVVVRRIGLTKDADKDFSSARNSLESAWGKARTTLAANKRPEPDHTVFVIPNDKSAGRMENLCISAPAYPGVLKCADTAYDCAGKAETRSSDREKSIVAAYVSLVKPGLRLGTAVGAGCWDLKSAVFEPLRVFVRRIGSAAA
ncbi:MAG: DUF3226 domain-containing protein, partial [Terriglobia bacterium]